MDHFPDLTHRIAAQTVELANRGMGEWPRGGAGQLPAALLVAAPTFAGVNWLQKCTEDFSCHYHRTMAQD